MHHGDFHNTSSGDGCPICSTSSVPHSTNNYYPLIGHNAIEVGHTFLLGTKYSEPLKATFTPGNIWKLTKYGRIFADSNGLLWYWDFKNTCCDY
jgi:hypothetical protein